MTLVPLRTPTRKALVRLHASTSVRRVLPARLAFGLIAVGAAWSARRHTEGYEKAAAFQTQLLEHTSLASEAPALARETLAELWRVLEIFWRPWLMRSGGVENLEHMRASQASGRGVVAVFPHYGMPYAIFPIFHRFGIPAWTVAAPHHYVNIPEGYSGMFARRGRRYVDMIGPERALPRPGTYERSAELLRSGETVCIAFDVVGGMPTGFLGRTIPLASGPARLAIETDALVQPMVVRRREIRPVLRFGAPLDSRDFGDASSLQAAIAAVMEGWTLEAPEAASAAGDPARWPAAGEGLHCGATRRDHLHLRPLPMTPRCQRWTLRALDPGCPAAAT